MEFVTWSAVGVTETIPVIMNVNTSVPTVTVQEPLTGLSTRVVGVPVGLAPTKFPVVVETAGGPCVRGRQPLSRIDPWGDQISWMVCC